VTQHGCPGRHECVFVDGVWMVTVVRSLSSVCNLLTPRPVM